MTRRARSGDEGISLVEVLVGMSLMALVGTLVLSTVTSGLRTQRTMTDRASGMADLRTAAQRLSKDVREADPLLLAQEQALAVRQAVAGGHRDVTWRVIGTELVKDESTTTAAGVVSALPRVVVLRGLEAGAAPFGVVPSATYAPRAGSTTDPGTCVLAGSTPTTYAPECVGSVTLRLTRTLLTGAPLALEQTVELRNR